MNYYREDPDAYLADKANIFAFQKEDDTLVLGHQAAALIIDTYGERIASRIVPADGDLLPEDWELLIPGEHNRYNAALALAAARAAGVSDAASRAALEAFRGVPGRLEFLREVEGVKFYNDTTATTPEATNAALEALGAPGRLNIVLIMGGADKGLDMDALLERVPDYAKHVALLAGTGTPRVQGVLFEAPVFETLAEAFKDARAHARARRHRAAEPRIRVLRHVR